MIKIEIVRPKTPEIRQNFPIWFHSGGCKMMLNKFDEIGQRIVISASSAEIAIEPGPEIKDWYGWNVDWKIIQPDGVVVGRRVFENDTLAAACGLTNYSCRSGQWLIHKFGGNSAEQGMFIRWQNYLNIPCPGTGYDGDPNVSIRITDKIKSAVECLLS